jgi:hypothetical protein
MNIIILLFIIILFVLLGFFVETNKEDFLTLEKKNGEYYCEDDVKCPVRGLHKFCRDKGLEPAYMPQTCFTKTVFVKIRMDFAKFATPIQKN